MIAISGINVTAPGMTRCLKALFKECLENIEYNCLSTKKVTEIVQATIISEPAFMMDSLPRQG